MHRLSIAICLLLTATASAEWLPGWKYSRTITQDHTAVSADITNCVATIQLTGANFTFSQAKADGSDIRFTNSDSSELLDFDIESYDSENQVAVIHVRIPTAATDADTVIKMYWGNPKAGSWIRLCALASDMTNFGLCYPGTFIIDIPASSSGLTAWHRHSGVTWSQLTAKTTDDFFNGIECVRWDYDNNKAYVSVIVGDASVTSTYIDIRDSSGATVAMTYGGIAAYYDNRRCTVMMSWDDWQDSSDSSFVSAAAAHNSAHVVATVAIITGNCGASTWSSIQTAINNGYLEPASHGINVTSNPMTAAELVTSISDLKTNLTFPALNMRGSDEYLWCLCEPFGGTSTALRNQEQTSHVLIARDNITGANGARATWAGKTAGSLQSQMFTEVKTDYMLDAGDGGQLSTAEAAFDAVYNASGVFSAYGHPYNHNWTNGYILDFLTYIKDKTDCWYVGIGQAYAYWALNKFVRCSSGVWDETYRVVYHFNEASWSHSAGDVKNAAFGSTVESAEFMIYADNGTSSAKADLLAAGRFGQGGNLTSGQVNIDHREYFWPITLGSKVGNDNNGYVFYADNGFQISVWIKTSNDNTSRMIAKKGIVAGAVYDGTSIGVGTNNKPYTYLNSTTDYTLEYNGTVGTNWRHMYAQTKVGGACAIYMDGSANTGTNNGTSFDCRETEVVQLLASLAGSDEVRIPRSPLTAARISWEYTNGITANGGLTLGETKARVMGIMTTIGE